VANAIGELLAMDENPMFCLLDVLTIDPNRVSPDQAI